MEEYRFNHVSNFMFKKCGTKRLNDGVDRISQLPDEIILVILCFLPLREAARSSIFSSRWLGLWKHIPIIKFDRISQLPDPVIISILSLLSLKNAAATSVLSSRWSKLWKHTRNLSFYAFILDKTRGYRNRLRQENPETWDVESCKNVKRVDSVLESHKAISLKEFNIGFHVNRSALLKVATWLEYVVLREVERLSFDFQCGKQMYKVILQDLLRLCRPETIILFKSLKSVCLGSFIVSGEDIKLLLCYCPLLEELIISSVTLTSDVEICGVTLMLKHLEVYSQSANKSIKISAPNLTWLRVEDTSQNLLLENVPKLVGANFTFQSSSPDVTRNFASAVFCFSSQLKSLTLSINWPKIFFSNVFPQMPKLQKLRVNYCGVKRQTLLPVTALVRASPRLEEFTVVYKQTSDGASTEPIINAEGSPHQCLKVFILHGFIGGSDHMELVTYISDNCIALQEVIMYAGPSFASGYCRPIRWIKHESRLSRQYAKEHLKGKLPQHTQLLLL